MTAYARDAATSGNEVLSDNHLASFRPSKTIDSGSPAERSAGSPWASLRDAGRTICTSTGRMRVSSQNTLQMITGWYDGLKVVRYLAEEIRCIMSLVSTRLPSVP
jgi:hypothetical protein